MFWAKGKSSYEEQLAGKQARLASLKWVVDNTGSMCGRTQSEIHDLNEAIAMLKCRINGLKED